MPSYYGTTSSTAAWTTYTVSSSWASNMNEYRPLSPEEKAKRDAYLLAQKRKRWKAEIRKRLKEG